MQAIAYAPNTESIRFYKDDLLDEILSNLVMRGWYKEYGITLNDLLEMDYHTYTLLKNKISQRRSIEEPRQKQIEATISRDMARIDKGKL